MYKVVLKQDYSDWPLDIIDDIPISMSELQKLFTELGITVPALDMARFNDEVIRRLPKEQIIREGYSICWGGPQGVCEFCLSVEPLIIKNRISKQ